MNIKELAKQMFEFNDNEVARVDIIDIYRFADYVEAQAIAREREACAALCDDWFAGTAGQAIRERGKPDPAFKNFLDDKWSGIV